MYRFFAYEAIDGVDRAWYTFALKTGSSIAGGRKQICYMKTDASSYIRGRASSEAPHQENAVL